MTLTGIKYSHGTTNGMFTQQESKSMDTGMVFPFKDIGMAALSLWMTKTNGQKIHPWRSQKLMAPPKGKLTRTKTTCKWNQWKTNGITTQELSTHTPASPAPTGISYQQMEPNLGKQPENDISNKHNGHNTVGQPKWKTTAVMQTMATTHSDTTKGETQTGH
jgi:hypothetical protein